LVIVGFWIYFPALNGAFLWDDSYYVTANPLLNDPARLWKIWFDIGSTDNYFPLESTVQYLQWMMFGTNPYGYHVTNVGLHILSSLLIWRLLWRLGLKTAWLGGFLFLAHPMCVESVAWVSELKNTLSLPPFLLAMDSFVRSRVCRRGHYFAAVVWFLIAMLCKTTAIMFPFVILLYIWWKDGKCTKGDILQSLPFFAISLLLGATTLLAGARYAEAHLLSAPGGYGLLSGLTLSGMSILFYLLKCLFPVRPLPAYPMWDIEHPTLLAVLPWLLLACLVWFFWRKRSSWGRPALLGFGFFLLTIAPFSGIFATGNMDFTLVMDHFVYLPLIGIVGLMAAAFQLASAPNLLFIRWIVGGFAALTLGTFALITHTYAKAWRSDVALWTYAANVLPTSWAPHAKLGLALSKNAETAEEAIQQFGIALQFNPQAIEVYNNLGALLSYLPNRMPDAIAVLKKGISIAPGNASLHNNLGSVFAKDQMLQDAAQEYLSSIRLNPRFADAHNNLGNIYLEQPDKAYDAVAQYKAAIDCDPNLLKIHESLGDAYMLLPGHEQDALSEFRLPWKTVPTLAAAHDSLGIALARSPSRQQDAIKEFAQALALEPNSAKYHYDLGCAYLSQPNSMPQAIDEFEAAIRLDPDDAEAENNLGSALSFYPDRRQEAMQHLERALQLKPALAPAARMLQRLALLKSLCPAGVP